MPEGHAESAVEPGRDPGTSQRPAPLLQQLCAALRTMPSRAFGQSPLRCFCGAASWTQAWHKERPRVLREITGCHMVPGAKQKIPRLENGSDQDRIPARLSCSGEAELNNTPP